MAATKRPKPARANPTARGASEIAPGVFVGGWKDAEKFPGERFCVLDEAPDDRPASTHFRIYDDATDRADRSSLDRLADAVGRARKRGGPVLIFCGHGIRRSPLAGAWYLTRSEGISLDAAFERIQAVRPKVEPPRAWIGDTSSLDRA